MKSLLFALLVFIGSGQQVMTGNHRVVATPAGSAYTINDSQSAGGSSSGVTNTGSTAAISLSTGDVVAEWCNSANSAATYTANNSASMSYSGNSSLVANAGWGGGQIFYILNATAGSTTFSCSSGSPITFFSVGVTVFHHATTSVLAAGSDVSTPSCSGTTCTTSTFSNSGPGVSIFCGKVPGGTSTTATVGGNAATSGASGLSAPGCFYFLNSGALSGVSDQFVNGTSFGSWGISALSFK